MTRRITAILVERMPRVLNGVWDRLLRAREAVVIVLLLQPISSPWSARAQESQREAGPSQRDLAGAAYVPWHTRLFLPGNGTWRGRIPVDLKNTTGVELAGSPVSLIVGKSKGQIDIGGSRAREIRVCDASGVEMLFDLRDRKGRRLEDGPIQPDATLTVPCTAPVGGTQRLFVYFDNPDSYLVPDYLPWLTEVANGGFESGTGVEPEGWRFATRAESMRLTWVDDVQHSGRRCVMATVPDGAEPSWMTARQQALMVWPGKRYRLTAWIRGQDVVGTAGWYLHVQTPDDPLAVNVVKGVGEGSFDWRQVAIEFVAPAEAISMDHGTVLRGSGAAWFDDASLECLDDVPQVGICVGETERLELREIGGDGEFLTVDGRRWECRIPVCFVNVAESMRQELIHVRTARLRPLTQHGFHGTSLRGIDPTSRKKLPHFQLAEHLFFVADVPARCRKVFHIYLGPDPEITQGAAFSYDDLIGDGANLALNASFEDGQQLPSHWIRVGERLGKQNPRMQRVASGRVGQHCGRLTVGPEEPLRWTGWSQTVDVEPNTDYVFMAYVRTQEITDGQVRLHAHLLEDRGDHPDKHFWSSSNELEGTTNWQLLGDVLHTGPRTQRVILFLTMNARGTVYHDGVVFLKMNMATMAALEQRQAPDAPVLQIWTQNPLVKAFHDTPPPRPAGPGHAGESAVPVKLYAGRNEEECVQLCLRSVRTMRNVSVTVDAPSCRSGTLLPPRVERVGYVPVFQPSNFWQSQAEPWERRKPTGPSRNDGWLGWWPDYLLPCEGTVDLEANQTQPLWITFDILRDAPPGKYRSAVHVTTPDGQGTTIPIQLAVWRFTLPDRPTLEVVMDLRNGPGWSLYPTQAKVEQWWRFMAKHRVASDQILPPPVFAWANGEVTMDTTDFDRAAALYFDELHMAVAYFPQVFYACGWAHPPRRFMEWKYDTPEYRRAYQQAVQLFWDHVRAKGWEDRFVLYISDEPHYWNPEVVEWLGDVIRMIRKVAPTIPVYASTWGHVPEWDGVLNHWGIAQYGKFPIEVLRQRQEAGDKIWFTTDGQFELDTPYTACERLLPYYCLAYGVTGYEFWALPWYTYNPFRFGWYDFILQSDAPGDTYSIRYPNGSGHLAYPGELLGLAGPLSTIRLEQVREGIEDYELFAGLRGIQGGEHGAEIERLFDEVHALVPIPNAGGYRSTEILPQPEAVLELRRRAGELLDLCSGP